MSQPAVNTFAKDEDQDKIIEELNSYQAQLESFGTDIATRQRKNKLFDPAKWWLNHGTSLPNLKNLAVKILSLTCSSSACERNFSTFEQVHAKKRSRLLSGRLRDLVFVKFNSRIKHKRDNKMRDPIEKIIDVLEDESNEFITGIVPEDNVEVEEAGPTPQPEASTSQAQTKRKRRAKKRKKSIHSLLNSVQEEAVLSDSSNSSSSESEGEPLNGHSCDIAAIYPDVAAEEAAAIWFLPLFKTLVFQQSANGDSYRLNMTNLKHGL